MRVYVNGKESDVAEGLTVAAMVAEKGLSPNAVVVEHNSVILPTEKWPQCVLAAGDKLEMITFVGGG